MKQLTFHKEDSLGKPATLKGRAKPHAQQEVASRELITPLEGLCCVRAFLFLFFNFIGSLYIMAPNFVFLWHSYVCRCGVCFGLFVSIGFVSFPFILLSLRCPCFLMRDKGSRSGWVSGGMEGLGGVTGGNIKTRIYCMKIKIHF